MDDIVICALERCRKSFKSRFRLFLHMLIKHHYISKFYYIANIPLVICKNPKHCKYFYIKDEKSVKVSLKKSELDLLISKDTYLLSHMHHSKFKHHLLIIMIGRDFTLPDGPFLKEFQQKGTIARVETKVEDLMYLRDDTKNNVLEYDKDVDKLPLSVWLEPDLG